MGVSLMSAGGGGLPYKEILYAFNHVHWEQVGVLINKDSVNELSSAKSFSGEYLEWTPHGNEGVIEVTALKKCKVKTYMSTDDGNPGPEFSTVKEETVEAGEWIWYDGPNYLTYVVCVL